MAKTSAGKEVAGVMQADNETAVVRTLDERQLYPVSVKLQSSAGNARAGGRIRLRDVALFYGQLSDLLSAGVPLMRSLETLCKSIRNPRFVEIIQAVRQEVASGETLADAIARHPRAFTELQAAMIRAGERAGFLEEVLTNLGRFLDRQDELRNKVRGAMIYPMVLTTFG
ncbi:MAG: type II secretion system F family protein, partial [Planctomycetes bacterium]|nr:type II secretion system F family protein [Planctomycetota bacterium]